MFWNLIIIRKIYRIWKQGKSIYILLCLIKNAI
ncbi:Uncharacterised protein [Serratia rubidaea]|uniref:Uncharacterized protein n=1 Tax=Serratia rubidaea TaxID=61652 RepID=A0A3S4XW41_SERRU|nr:Uncharacterised protein [Serratia rubidaea]